MRANQLDSGFSPTRPPIPLIAPAALLAFVLTVFSPTSETIAQFGPPPRAGGPTVSIRVLSPGGDQIVIDDVLSVAMIEPDGANWHMGPQPVVRSHGPDGSVTIDAILLPPNADGMPLSIIIESGGVAIEAGAKMPGGRPTSLDLTANASPSEIGADSSAGPGAVADGEIAGVVVDPKGIPVAGAVVSFPRPAQFARLPSAPPVSTGKDGVFRFPKSDSPRGGLYMQVEKAGYAPRWITDTPVGKGFTIHLDNKTHLTGKLTLPDGSPAANAQIDLTAHKPSKHWGNQLMDDAIHFAAKADDQGKYDLLLEPDKFDVSITAPAGFVARHQQVQVVSGQTTALPPELSAAVKLTMLAINTATAQPVPGIHFFQAEESPGYLGYRDGSERITDDKGEAKWDVKLPGPAAFMVSADGFGRWWIMEQTLPGRETYTPGIDLLRLNLAVDMPMVMVAMEPAVRVSGQVLSPTGDPVSGAFVDIGRLDTGDSRYAKRTDDQGRFSLSFPNLPPRPGMVPDGAPRPDFALIAYDTGHHWANAVSEGFNPNAGDEKTFVLRMSAGGSIRGAVVDAAGKSVAKIEVRAMNTDQFDAGYYYSKTLTDAAGHFELDHVRPGEYEPHLFNFLGGGGTKYIAGKRILDPSDHVTMVTVKDGQSLNLDPITYDGPPPGAVPAQYDRRYPQGIKPTSPATSPSNSPPH